MYNGGEKMDRITLADGTEIENADDDPGSICTDGRPGENNTDHDDQRRDRNSV